MKKIYLMGIIMFGFSYSQACPEMKGTYECKSSDNHTYNFVVDQKIVNGSVVYVEDLSEEYPDAPGAIENFYTDNIWRDTASEAPDHFLINKDKGYCESKTYTIDREIHFTSGEILIDKQTFKEHASGTINIKGSITMAYKDGRQVNTTNEVNCSIVN